MKKQVFFIILLIVSALAVNSFAENQVRTNSQFTTTDNIAEQNLNAKKRKLLFLTFENYVTIAFFKPKETIFNLYQNIGAGFAYYFKKGDSYYNQGIAIQLFFSFLGFSDSKHVKLYNCPGYLSMNILYLFKFGIKHSFEIGFGASFAKRILNDKVYDILNVNGIYEMNNYVAGAVFKFGYKYISNSKGFTFHLNAVFKIKTRLYSKYINGTTEKPNNFFIGLNFGIGGNLL